MTAIKKRTTLTGVTALADELGVSRYHLGAVLHGRRSPGLELAAKLADRGIRIPRLRRRSERWV